MPYITVGDQGLVVYPGTGVNTLPGDQVASGAMGVSNFPYVVSVITASSNQTFNQGGMYILSSSGPVTASMPDPGRVPGAKFIFRAGSAHAHAITGTVGGFQCFSVTPGITATGVRGSRILMDSAQNSSVVLESDGFHYLISAASGTHTLAQS